MTSSVAHRIDRLRVMSWAGGWGRALRTHVSDPFEASTGIPVEQHVNVGLKLPASLDDARRTGGEPPFDVVWSNAVPALHAARRGMVDPLDADAVPGLEHLGRRADFSRRVGSPFAVPYVVHYVLTYRRAAFPGAAPEGYDVLMSPRHSGKIALYPGGNGFFPLAQLLGGGALSDIPANVSPCFDYLARLAPRIGRLGYSVGMADDFVRGDLDLAFRALTNALAFRDEGADVGWVVPREGVTDTVDALWIPAGLAPERRAWAARFIDFALRADVQTRWCEALGVMPTRRDATVPALFGEARGLPANADDLDSVLHVPEDVKADHEPEWEARFDAIIAAARSRDVRPP